MLTDTERKVLRVLWGLYGTKWTRPDLKKVCRLTGRSPEQVREATKGLAAAGYLETNPEALRVLRGWEPEPPPRPRWIPVD